MSGQLVSKILQKQIKGKPRRTKKGDLKSDWSDSSLKLLVLTLASHCFGESLSCWPSITLLALECQITKRQIYNLLSELKRLGYVTSQRRSRQSAIFTLDPTKMPDLRGEAYVTSKTPQGEEQCTPEVKPSSLRGEVRFTRNKEEPVLTGKSNRKSSVPDWVPTEQWEAFAELRRKIRAPLTDYAIVLIVNKLEKLKQAGQDPGAVLDQSVERGWRGVFPVRQTNEGNSHGYESASARRARRNREACEQAEKNLHLVATNR